MLVDINLVVPLGDKSSWATRKMRKVLEKQGQIEPLQVHEFEGKYIVFHNDPWGTDIVYAARELGWDKLLVTEMKAYQP